MDFFLGLFKNFYVMCAAVSWLTAQFLKIATGAFKNKTKKMSVTEVLFGTGGMPSSHTAAVMSLASASAIQCGLASFEFAISFILALVVIRDATGVRREVGKHSELLNSMRETDEDGELPGKDLFKEFIGHTPAQVFVGAILGIIVPICMSFIPAFRINLMNL